MRSAFRQLIRDHDDGGHIDDVTLRIIADILDENRAVAEWLLGGLVRAAVQRARREQVKFRERAVLVDAGSGTDALSALRRLAHDTFYDPGSKLYVRYEDATVRQHEAYIDALQRSRAGIDKTIYVHEMAIGLIERARVTQLREVPGWRT